MGGTPPVGGATGIGGAHPGGAGPESGGASPSTGGHGSGGTGSGGAGNGGAGSGGKGSGGSPGDAGPARWCDGQNVLFCEDFDGFASIDDLFNTWTNVSTTGGTFSFDTGAGVPSGPNALRVRTTTASGVQTLAVQNLAPFAARPSKIRMEFDLRIDAADAVDAISGAAFAGILTGTKLSDGIIGLETSINPALTGPALYGGYIDSSGTDGETAFSTPWPKENQWLDRFAIEITYSSTSAGTRTGCVQIFVAGVKQMPACQKLSALLLDPPRISVVLGIYSGGLGTTGDIQLRFDNVTLTAQ